MALLQENFAWRGRKSTCNDSCLAAPIFERRSDLCVSECEIIQLYQEVVYLVGRVNFTLRANVDGCGYEGWAHMLAGILGWWAGEERAAGGTTGYLYIAKLAKLPHVSLTKLAIELRTIHLCQIGKDV